MGENLLGLFVEFKILFLQHSIMPAREIIFKSGLVLKMNFQIWKFITLK